VSPRLGLPIIRRFLLGLALVGQGPPAHGEVVHDLAGFRTGCRGSQAFARSGAGPIVLRCFRGGIIIIANRES
jgi:hypothetical protein